MVILSVQLIKTAFAITIKIELAIAHLIKTAFAITIKIELAIAHLIFMAL